MKPPRKMPMPPNKRRAEQYPEQLTHSALRWVQRYEKRYPLAWNHYARLINSPPANWRWSRACFCPLAGAWAVISDGGRLPIPPPNPVTHNDISGIGTVAAWRITKGIYVIDPTLFEELWHTPISGDIPVDVLERLPEWCPYIETPQLLESGIRGFFASVEHDANTHRKELRIELDYGERLRSLVVHLGGTVDDGVRNFLVECRTQAMRQGKVEEAPSLSGTSVIASAVAPFVSLVLYLCADDAEIAGRQKRAERPPINGTKHGPRLICAEQPTVYACGARLGASLFEARERYARETAEHPQQGVMPHVRRAHWHSFWSGPRSCERKLTLKWLSPILVNFERDEVPDVAVVRPVEAIDRG